MLTDGTPPKLLQSLMDMVVAAPEEVHLECEFDVGKPPANITWFKDNRQIQKSSSYKQTLTDKLAVLYIQKTEPSYTGNYSCEALNKHGKVSTECFLEVQNPPVLRADKTELIAKEGSSLKIQVEYSGLPLPSLKWKHNGNDILHDITNDGGVSELALSNVNQENFGTYKLEAKNEIGKSEIDIQVKVIGKPSEPQELEVKDVNKTYVILTWKPPKSDGGSKIKKYTIEKADSTKLAFTTAGATENLEFKVTKLHEGNEYNFKVAAENEVGLGTYAKINDIKARLPFGKILL